MSDSRIRPRASVVASILAAAVLAACGGGGGDAPVTQTTAGPAAPVVPPPAEPAPALAPACTGCGAADGSNYTGSGTGVWAASNTSGTPVDVPVAIGGVNGKPVTLLYTNGATAQAMPALSLSVIQPVVGSLALQSVQAAPSARDEQTMRDIGEFNRTGWAALAGAKHPASQSEMAAPPPHAAVVNDVKNWYHTDGTSRSATLERQVLAPDGTTVNFWVETAEWTQSGSKVSDTILDALAAGFAGPGGIYAMLTSVGGPLWGPHSYSNLIAGTGQPVDIVILNFDNNATPFGTVGYFWGVHNLLKTSDPRSNESLSLYLDSETLYLGGTEGMKSMKMTMAHEGMHMQNFYRRGVKAGSQYAFQTWLEEMSAMMMEDFASHTIDPSYNAIRDVRFRDYVGYGNGNFNCNILNFTGFGPTCESYSVSGSFGGFLDRQLGLAFYKDLLTRTSSSDSQTVLDQAIKAARADSGFQQELLRWSVTSNSLMPAASSPARYGYPERVDGGFTLPVIDPSLYSAIRRLPASVAATLQPYGSFPVVRTGTGATFSETVRVPAGSTLSVVVY
ncbi:M30 family zinc metallopeptidase [Cupriavidus sp. 30B13]|uniref:M30 family zinc metallopeptidase n=1 Tax=Cupriavidus sp. 30B13 TaxID=3384241 RepID=UPI003B8F3916